MAASDVKRTYQDVINDVCTAVREALLEEGYDDHTLHELRDLWLKRLENSKALEPLQTSAVDQATTRDYRHSGAGEAGNSSKQSTGMKQINSRLAPASNAGVPTFNTTFPATTSFNPGLLSSAGTSSTQFVRATYPARPANPTNIVASKTANQLDGANDEEIPENSTTKKNKRRKKKSPIVEIAFQLDGTGPPVGDDEDDDEDSEAEGNDVADDIDDDDDEDGAEEGKDDPNPLCSDDDVSDDETTELFDTENVVVCQYDKISRTKNKWRFILKSGVMHIEGRDYVFSKATGEADW